MRIPTNLQDREEFYLDLMRKCTVSRETRKADYAGLRSWYLFGNGPSEAPALFNKIYPHIDQLSSFLYSAETTRFSINIGADVSDKENDKTPVLTRAINDRWLDTNADQIFSGAVSWALAYNSMFVKLVVNNGIHPYLVEPACIGVLREDQPYTDRQEALTHSYYITKSELYSRLYSHPKRDSLIKRIGAQPHDRTEVANGVERIILSQSDPTMYGNVNLDLSGMNRYKAEVAEETVEMTELWVWNDDTLDYQVITIAEPDVVVYDREGDKMFLKGELPFVQVCPNPLYDYYYGASEVARLVYLQQMRTKRLAQIMDLLDKQVSPPTALQGFMGILDEKDFALNRAGGLLASQEQGGKVERFAPDLPPDLFAEVSHIDEMFQEASGLGNVVQGKGEAGVRSSGHASQLARLGSSRAKKRALVIEDALEKLATLYLKLMRKYDDTHFKDVNNKPFIAEQFTADFAVKVDAHSNSPIFTDDLHQLAFNLLKVGAIDKESLLDLVEPPMKQLLKDRLHKAEQRQKLQVEHQPPSGGKEAAKPEAPSLKQVK